MILEKKGGGAEEDSGWILPQDGATKHPVDSVHVNISHRDGGQGITAQRNKVELCTVCIQFNKIDIVVSCGFFPV